MWVETMVDYADTILISAALSKWRPWPLGRSMRELVLVDKDRTAGSQHGSQLRGMFCAYYGHATHRTRHSPQQ